jgi:hypothetical protein
VRFDHDEADDDDQEERAAVAADAARVAAHFGEGDASVVGEDAQQPTASFRSVATLEKMRGSSSGPKKKKSKGRGKVGGLTLEVSVEVARGDAFSFHYDDAVLRRMAELEAVAAHAVAG